MTNAKIQGREIFLKSLHEKLGTTPQLVTEHPFIPVNDLPHEQLADKSTEELIEIAREKLKDIHTELQVTTTAELSDILLGIMKEVAGGPILLPSTPAFKADFLAPFIEAEKADIHYWQQGNDYRELNIKQAQASNVSIAFAEFLLAESGTVVVESSAAQGRTLHFLPDNYIAIIPKSKIVARSTQAADFYAEKIAKGEETGSAIHFISGPSNSGDIEMELVVGLHGPVKVYYIVVEDL